MNDEPRDVKKKNFKPNAILIYIYNYWKGKKKPEQKRHKPSLALRHTRGRAGGEFSQSAWQPIRVQLVVAQQLVDGGVGGAIVYAVHPHPTGVLHL